MTGGEALAPLAALYGAAVRARLALYRSGLMRVARAGRPVVSVGNIAAGGTGKTPFLAWLAGELVRRHLPPAILTRGYGRKTRRPVLVSDGERILAGADEAGDEPLVLARQLRGVPILADANRTRGARRIEELFPHVKLHLLDDGFSHLALGRDVDVVLLDAARPDAGGALLPRGRLREPLSSLARADILLVTRLEEATPDAALALARRYAPGIPIFGAETEVLGILDRHGDEVRPADLPEGTVLAVAGVARPEAFFGTLDRLGIRPLAHLSFPDHARYGNFRIGRILKVAEETGATGVVTTEKDAVKLEGALGLPLFTVRIRTRPREAGFLSELLGRLEQRPS